MRKTWIDIAKGIGILCVVAGHTALVKNKVAWSLIYSFHMPIFFVVAGYCYDSGRYKTFREYFVRKCKVLVWPYLMLTLAVAVLETFIYCDIRHMRLLFHIYPGIGMIGFWFIRALFLTELLFALLINVKWWYVCACFALLLGLSDAIPSKGEFFDFVRISEVLKGLFFYGIGFASRRLKMENLRASALALFSMACFIVYIALLGIAGYPHLNYQIVGYNGESLTFIVSALLGSVAIMSFSRAIGDIPCVAKPLAWFGRYSLLLLAFHPLCGEMRNALVRSYPCFSGLLSYALEFVAIAVLMWLFSGPLVFFLRMPIVKWRFRK